MKTYNFYNASTSDSVLIKFKISSTGVYDVYINNHFEDSLFYVTKKNFRTLNRTTGKFNEWRYDSLKDYATCIAQNYNCPELQIK